MNLESIQALADQQKPLYGTAVFLRYRSLYDWRPSRGETPTEAEYRAAYAETDAVAAVMATRGIQVRGVEFELGPYRRWLDRRPDTPDERERWGREQIGHTGPNTFHFTLGDPPPEELVPPAVRALFGDAGESMGWVSERVIHGQ